MVCYYRNLPKFEACKKWLRSLIDRKISDKPEPHVSVMARPDLTNYIKTETPHEAQRRVERLKKARATKAEQSPAPEAFEGDWIDGLSPDDLRSIDEGKLEQAERDGLISKSDVLRIYSKMRCGDYR